jgi:23S rRNA pseudouridine2605 synthase
MKPRKNSRRKRGSYIPQKERDIRHTPDYDFLKKRPREKKSANPTIRLNKYISNSGICSRREADNLIVSGKIKVNGNVITELGYKVNPDDKVSYQGKILKREKLVYILMNKPKDHITTSKDPQQRATVMDLIHNHIEERVYPVGRLDRNTTGLLLLTNDGELTRRLSHPSYNIRKIYEVQLDKVISEEDFMKIKGGIELDDGPIKPDDLAIVKDDRKTLGIEIHSGRNRIVRRIFESLGYRLVKLDRVMYAFLTKKDLPRGKWRFLQEHELIRLKHFGTGKSGSGRS